jgi:hypothetical protein
MTGSRNWKGRLKIMRGKNKNKNKKRRRRRKRKINWEQIPKPTNPYHKKQRVSPSSLCPCLLPKTPQYSSNR